MSEQARIAELEAQVQGLQHRLRLLPLADVAKRDGVQVQTVGMGLVSVPTLSVRAAIKRQALAADCPDGIPAKIWANVALIAAQLDLTTDQVLDMTEGDMLALLAGCVEVDLAGASFRAGRGEPSGAAVRGGGANGLEPEGAQKPA